MYDKTFFDYITHGSRRSAEVVTAALVGLIPVKSVLDVGCGRGAWLDAWRKLGVSDVLGLDGNYVPAESLLVPSQHFRAVDLTQPLHLDRTFDLVQSLEVAEHLPPSATETFIATLTRHADVVLFSAARPGQGGENHLNEHTYEYWRRQFNARGFAMYDAVRPLIDDRSVEPWYRYNSFLFVSKRRSALLPPTMRKTRIDEGSPVLDVAPLWWRARCGTLRLVPSPLVNRLAVAKHRVVLGWRAVTSRHGSPLS